MSYNWRNADFFGGGGLKSIIIVIIIIQFDLCSFAVRQAREAALDAQLLVVATDLGKEKATQLFAEGNTFDPTAFAEHLVSEFNVYTRYGCVHKELGLGELSIHK